MELQKKALSTSIELQWFGGEWQDVLCCALSFSLFRSRFFASYMLGLLHPLYLLSSLFFGWFRFPRGRGP